MRKKNDKKKNEREMRKKKVKGILQENNMPT